MSDVSGSSQPGLWGYLRNWIVGIGQGRVQTHFCIWGCHFFKTLKGRKRKNKTFSILVSRCGYWGCDYFNSTDFSNLDHNCVLFLLGCRVCSYTVYAFFFLNRMHSVGSLATLTMKGRSWRKCYCRFSYLFFFLQDPKIYSWEIDWIVKNNIYSS